ncbi:hypothetical protein ACFL57_00810 [Candidatus Margulisiibacteriota bacterium]
MFKKALIVILVLFSAVHLQAELINDTFYISPLNTDPVQSTAIFSNPAELAHWNNLAGLDLRYRTPDNAFSGTLTFKTPDFLLGNFSLSMEAFGTDFGSNLIWIPETSTDEGHFSLTRGGQKFVFGWAKLVDQVTFGADFKYYRYRELDTSIEEHGAGFDLGFLYHPFKRLYFGIVINDLTGTEVYDPDKNLLYEIPERIRLSAAIQPFLDLSLTVGAPIDIFSDRLDSRETWKKASFSVRKIWDRGLNAELGYNSRDAYASLGYIISDAINIKAVISNDLTIKDGQYEGLFIFSAVMPNRVWNKISKGLFRGRKIIHSGKKGTNPWDFLFNMWVGINDNLLTRSIYLDYTDPEETKDSVIDMLSPDGEIKIDYQRNRLIVTDFRDNVMDIIEAIRRIEARAARRFQERQQQFQPPRSKDNIVPGPVPDRPRPGRGFF